MELDKYYQHIKDDCPPSDEQKRLGAFAVKQYKAYKLAAGKTAKSILISCSTRLAPFAIDEVLEITSYDELGLVGRYNMSFSELAKELLRIDENNLNIK